MGRGRVATRHWKPFLWQKDAVTNISSRPADRDSSASAINEHGQIVGEKEGSGVFLWQNGRMTYLGILVDNQAALAIDEHGQITGTMAIGPSTTHAFLWQNGQAFS